jgi:hypothetical protein
VHDEAHIRLVDAHPEGHRGDHHDPVLLEEGVLVPGPVRRTHAGMVGQGAIPFADQFSRKLFRRVARRAVHDAALLLVPLDELEELPRRVLLGLHRQAQVGPVEPVQEDARLALEQALEDVAAGR